MSGRVTPYTVARGRAGVWLLDLHLGGRASRWTSAPEPVSVVDEAGVTQRYQPGMESMPVRIDGRLETLGIQINGRDVDWAQLVARGDTLEQQLAIVRYWYPGQTLGEARHVLRGGVTEPEYGEPGLPHRLTFTLDARAFDRFELYPPLQAAIDANVTWEHDRAGGAGPIVDAAVEGLTYPVVWGYPGGGDDATTTPDPATPAYLVDQDGTIDSKFLLSMGDVDAGSVHLWDSEDTQGPTNEIAHDDVAVTTGSDLLGQVVSYGSPVVGGGVLNIEGHRYYAGWSRHASLGGGSVWRGEVLRLLGDFLVWVLANSGRQVDLDRQEAEADRLNRYRTDGYLNQRVDLVAWCDANIQPLFPIMRTRGPLGIWYRYLNWWATAADAVAHLSTATGRVVRASSLRTTRGQLANVFTLEYRRNAITGHHRGRRILDARHQEHRFGVDADERIVGSPRCRLSQQRYGVQEAPVRQTAHVWSDRTALGILEHWAQRDALPRRLVTYEGPHLEHLEPGDVVLLTDAEVHLDEAVALVDAVHLTGRRLTRIDLQVLEPALRATT